LLWSLIVVLGHVVLLKTRNQVVIAAVLLDRHRVLCPSSLDVDSIDLILSERAVILETASLLLGQLGVCHASTAKASVSRGDSGALLENAVVQF
jgi:hypothetical protein